VDVKRKSGSHETAHPDKSVCGELLDTLYTHTREHIREVLTDAASPLEEAEIPDLGKSRYMRGAKGKKQSLKKRMKQPIDLWLRINSAKTLCNRMPFVPDRFLLPITKSNLSHTGQLKRYLGRRVRDLTWCLPPIVFEGEQSKLRKQIQLLIRSGFRSFQIGHITQFAFFKKDRVFLSCDYTLNLLNSQAVSLMAEGGMEAAQLSIESDRKILIELIARYHKVHSELKLGLTVYGAPALFTARIDPDHFNYNKTLNSPKQEQFILLKKENVTATVPVRPFSLLPYLHELKAAGLNYAVVDLSNLHEGKKELEELAGRLAGTGKYSKLPTFNYLGTLE
jgi:putative protease